MSINICKNKTVGKITNFLLYILVIILLIYLVDYLYKLIFKNKVIEGNDNIVQSQCNIKSSDSPQNVSIKFNEIKEDIDKKLDKLTKLASTVSEQMHSN